jgi:hypothetical protein
MDQDTDKIIDGLKDKAPETYQVMMELRRERQEREAKQEKKRGQNVIILLPSIWILIYLLLWYVFDQSGIGDRWWLACWILWQSLCLAGRLSSAISPTSEPPWYSFPRISRPFGGEPGQEADCELPARTNRCRAAASWGGTATRS